MNVWIRESSGGGGSGRCRVRSGRVSDKADPSPGAFPPGGAVDIVARTSAMTQPERGQSVIVRERGPAPAARLRRSPLRIRHRTANPRRSCETGTPSCRSSIPSTIRRVSMTSLRSRFSATRRTSSGKADSPVRLCLPDRPGAAEARQLTMAMPETANSPHLAASSSITGEDHITSVPLQGGRARLNDLMGLQIPTASTISPIDRPIQAGTVRRSRVTTIKRSCSCPTSTSQSRSSAIHTGVWVGVVGPAACRANIQERLSKACAEAMKMPRRGRTFRTLGATRSRQCPPTSPTQPRRLRQWGP